MINVYLLKEYQNHSRGEIISVSNNVAFGLVENGVARQTSNRDFMQKSEFGETKSFGTAPSKKRYPKKDK